jgi:hypothetical protein
MRKAIPIISLLAAVATLAAYPGYDLIPEFNLADSVSVREWGFQEASGSISRHDYFVRGRDGAGRVTRLDIVRPSVSGNDSEVFLYDWTLSIPSIYLGAASIFTETPTRTISVDFLAGIQTALDTGWSSWDDSRKILTTTSSSQFVGCRWTDSSVFDAGNRLLFESDCEGDTVNASTVVPLYYLYNAMYANSTDSLPVREISRDSSNGVLTFQDTVSVTGNPNRPDTMIKGGAEQYLTWDSAGRLAEIIDVPQVHGYGMQSFKYDTQGRLILDIRSGAPGDTTQYLYAWSDATAIRPRALDHRGFRLVGSTVEVDLPASDRLRIDQLDLEGRVLANMADRLFPAGRSLLPLPSCAMGLVRLHSSQGESVLLVPPR